MGQKYTLEEVAADDSVVLIHPAVARTLKVAASRPVTIRFGLLEHPAELRISRKAAPERMAISKSILWKLQIPLFCRYEIRLDHDALLIGPYLAIVPEDTDERLAPRIRSDKITSASLYHYTQNYDVIGGAILAFSEQGISLQERGIHGYMFNPHTREWEKGVYPYPASVFKKLRLLPEINKHLEQTIGSKHLFNNPACNKYQINKLLCEAKELQPHLPDTILYRKPKDIARMLALHRKVYVKPVTGQNTAGIWKIRQADDGIIAQTYRRGRNTEYRFLSFEAAQSLFMQYFPPERMIVQQGLNLFDNHRRMVDFRLILVKDQTGKWKDRGIYARYGQPERIVSNRNSGSEAVPGEAALVSLLGFSAKDASLMRERMSSTAMAIGKRMDECGGCYGNLGVDLAIDDKRRLWIIEVNQVDPGHSIVYAVGEKERYGQIRLDNMLYAKMLAGFEVPEGGKEGEEDGRGAASFSRIRRASHHGGGNR